MNQSVDRHDAERNARARLDHGTILDAPPPACAVVAAVDGNRRGDVQVFAIRAVAGVHCATVFRGKLDGPPEALDGLLHRAQSIVEAFRGDEHRRLSIAVDAIAVAVLKLLVRRVHVTARRAAARHGASGPAAPESALAATASHASKASAAHPTFTAGASAAFRPGRAAAVVRATGTSGEGRHPDHRQSCSVLHDLDSLQRARTCPNELPTAYSVPAAVAYLPSMSSVAAS